MKKLLTLAAIAPLAVLGACSSGQSNNNDSLRQEIASVRSIAQAADQKATNAQATAQQALEQANLANEKADRVFRSGLRK